jgi:hypothetical protein
MGLDLSHVRPTKDEGLEGFTKDELSANPECIARYNDWFHKDDDGNDVLYFVEKGYQRKGVIKEFYADFENCVPYFEKRSVEKVMIYLDLNSPFSADFKKNFVDNFIEGESMFYASW